MSKKDKQKSKDGKNPPRCPDCGMRDKVVENFFKHDHPKKGCRNLHKAEWYCLRCGKAFDKK